MAKRALITGVSGQDGALLANLLLAKGYTVFGTSRDAELSGFRNLERLGIKDRVSLLSMAPADFRSVLQIFDQVQADEIYNLAGQSSVGLSFEQPVETLESISVGVLNMLESIRFLKHHVKFYNAASSECFGDTGAQPATEETAFQPRSPYAVAKATAFWQAANYRDSYGIFACSGILFNHESPLRPTRFVTQKIASAAARIASGEKMILQLGTVSVARDWGWAEEYVEAIHAMLQLSEPQDFVIASGNTISLEDYVAATFAALGLDWREFVKIDQQLRRPSDIAASHADPSKAASVLGWNSKVSGFEVAGKMAQAAFDRLSRETF